MINENFERFRLGSPYYVYSVKIDHHRRGYCTIYKLDGSMMKVISRDSAWGLDTLFIHYSVAEADHNRGVYFTIYKLDGSMINENVKRFSLHSRYYVY